MNAWPHDIPKPSQTVIDDMACAAIMAKNTTGMADARRLAEIVFPDFYRIVKADLEAHAKSRGSQP